MLPRVRDLIAEATGRNEVTQGKVCRGRRGKRSTKLNGQVEEEESVYSVYIGQKLREDSEEQKIKDGKPKSVKLCGDVK